MIGRLLLLPGLIVAAILATILLWGSYNAWFFIGDNYRQALSPILVPVRNWRMVEGGGGVQGSRFWLSSPGSRGYGLAVGALREPIEPGRLDRVVVYFSRLGGYHGLLAGVTSSDTLLNLREASLRLSDDLQGTLEAADLLLPAGEISYLTLRVRGGLEPAMVIDQVELHRVKPGFVELQGLLLESLIDFGAWTQRSINYSRPDYVPLRLSPVVVVVIWMVLFGLFSLALVARACFLGERWALLVGLALVLGWILLDVVWQASLWSRHFDAVRKYAGVPSERKVLNDLDAEVSGFISKLQIELGDNEQPLVIMGGGDFTQMRARYAGVPHPVVSRTGFNERWMRRLKAGDILVTIGLHNELTEKAQALDEHGTHRQSHEWSLSNVSGSNTEMLDCVSVDIACKGSALRSKEDQRTWLVQSSWLQDLAAGLWQVEFDLQGGSQVGWVRLEVFQRGTGNGRRRWAWRDAYLHKNQSRRLSLAFRVDEHAGYRIRLSELDARGVVVQGAQLVPRSAGEDLVELSPDGDPPYFLARRILESEGKFAWEML